MKISSVEEMRSLDKRAIEEFGIQGIILMENAGGAVTNAIMKEMDVTGKQFLIFCGSGNNGGDGLVIARKLLSNGGEPHVILMSDPEKFEGIASTNFKMVESLPLEATPFEDDKWLLECVNECDVIVDALLGTGITGEVRGPYKKAIELISQSGKPVFSVDIPSGINGNNGQVMGTAVDADCTVTFGLPKLGNILYPGFARGGKLYVTHISFPPSIYDHLTVEISQPVQLPERDEAGHKGTFGEVLFIAGAASYLGAPYFSALSFLKAGGGYSRLATPASISSFLANKGSEVVYLPMEETGAGSISTGNLDYLLEVSETMDMVVLGPGLSLDEETQELVRELTTRIDKPLLIDGDGITAISEYLEVVRDREAPTILTPHPGEMTRISKRSKADIMEDRIGVLRDVTDDLDSIVVLKEAHSLIGLPDGRVFVNMSGNPGMATAGSGDVLTGTVAAMYGLGLSIEESVRMGVFVHGLSGDLAAEEKGEDGMTAQDILDYLPPAVKRCREALGQLSENYYGKIRTV